MLRECKNSLYDGIRVINIDNFFFYYWFFCILNNDMILKYLLYVVGNVIL